MNWDWLVIALVACATAIIVHNRIDKGDFR